MDKWILMNILVFMALHACKLHSYLEFSNIFFLFSFSILQIHPTNLKEKFVRENVWCDSTVISCDTY